MKKRFYLLVTFLVFFACKEQNKSKPSTKSVNVEVLPFFNSGDFTPEWINSSDAAYKQIHEVGDFSFINQTGKVVTQDDYKGKIYIADFFFTNCTGICRSLSLNMKALQDHYMDDAELLFISHSVTPELDSVPVLKKYAENYGVDASKWNLVTGDKEKIYELARTAYFSDDEYIKSQTASDFIHTENFLLVDKKGRIRGVYNGTLQLEVKRIIKHIELLKKEVE